MKQFYLWIIIVFVSSAIFYEKGLYDNGIESIYNSTRIDEGQIEYFKKRIKEDNSEKLALLILSKERIHIHTVLDKKYEILVGIREKESNKIIYGNIGG